MADLDKSLGTDIDRRAEHDDEIHPLHGPPPPSEVSGAVVSCQRRLVVRHGSRSSWTAALRRRPVRRGCLERGMNWGGGNLPIRGEIRPIAYLNRISSM